MKAKYYTACSELPLWNFIKVITSGDVSFLLIKKGLIKYSLEPVWEQIFNEYLELSRTPHYARMVQLMIERNTLANKIRIVDALVSALAIRRSDGLIAVLKSMGFGYPFNDLNKDLERVITKTKTWLFRLQKVDKDLAKISSDEKISEADFDSILTELSRFQGYRIDPKLTTVSEYIAILERFKKHNNGKQGTSKRNSKQ